MLVILVSLSLICSPACKIVDSSIKKEERPTGEQSERFEGYSDSFVKVEYYLDSDEKKDIQLWSGSAAYIQNVSEESNLVLTAAHVCHLSPAMSLNLRIKFGIRVSEYKKEIRLKNSEFNTIAKPIAIDKKNDVCLMKAKKSNIGLKVSDKAPEYGEEYYNIAAPAGVYGKDMNLLFQGYFSGKKKIKKVKRDFYTIPVTGGSSGSPIINRNGEVVGLVSMGLNQFENMSISPEFKHIQSILYEST